MQAHKRRKLRAGRIIDDNILDIINQVAKVTGGGGGGKAGMAQAGGKDAAKVDEALKLVGKLVRKV